MNWGKFEHPVCTVFGSMVTPCLLTREVIGSNNPFNHKYLFREFIDISENI